MQPALSIPLGHSDPRTLADQAAILLARLIVSGSTPPGSRLNVVKLSQQHGIGATPIREALSRLISSGLVVANGQKGFRVAEISPEDLVDIVRMRLLVEVAALRLSMAKGDTAWEADVLHATHMLIRHQDRNPESSVLEADELHKRFHTALISACGSRRMLELHSVLFDQGHRYRVLLLPSVQGHGSMVENHRQLAEKAIQRSPDAADMLAAQLRRPLEMIYPQAAHFLND